MLPPMLRLSLLSAACGLVLVPAVAGQNDVARAVAKLTGGDEKSRARARDELLEGGKENATALVEMLEAGSLTKGQENRVLDVLADLGPEAVVATPRVINELKDVAEDDQERIGALLRGLAEIVPYSNSGEEALEALSARVQLIHKDSSSYVRAYSRLQLTPDAPVQEMLTWLQSSNPYEREFAALLLGARGHIAKSALPELIAVRDDKTRQPFNIGGPNWSHSSSGGSTSSVRRAAAIAIARIAPHDPEAVQGLRYLLVDGRRVERARAARSLAAFGPQAAPAVPGLIKSLHDHDPRVVREAITALGVVGPDAATAKWELQELTKHEDKQIAARARAALRQIEGTPPGR